MIPTRMVSNGEFPFIFDIPGGKRPSSARKKHICRLYDILQLCIQRGDLDRARRAWSILVRCKEIDWRVMWRIGLTLVPRETAQVGSEAERERTLEYLSSVMLQIPESRETIIHEKVLQLILAEKYRTALDEMELYLPSPPYQDNPSLHVYAGMVCIFLAQPSEAEAGAHTPPTWNEGMLRQARQYLERAVSLGQDDVVAKSWLEKLPTLTHPATPVARGGSPESDDDEMTLDGEEGTQQRKRTKTDLASSPTVA